MSLLLAESVYLARDRLIGQSTLRPLYAQNMTKLKSSFVEGGWDPEKVTAHISRRFCPVTRRGKPALSQRLELSTVKLVGLLTLMDSHPRGYPVTPHWVILKYSLNYLT